MPEVQIFFSLTIDLILLHILVYLFILFYDGDTN